MRLGPDHKQRFLPTRFTIEGAALDAKGFPCTELACPRCYLPIPRILLEKDPFFISILGSPACGKSFFLTALTWEARRLFPTHFGLSFADADPVSNRALNENEESLFLTNRGDAPIPLADLIRKTELQGDQYDTVSYGSQTVAYPRPFLFSLFPRDTEREDPKKRRVGRVLCLYDNAGEHFLAGQDLPNSAVTQHMAYSRLLLYLFDPTGDLRFCQLCERQGIQFKAGQSRTGRQESILHEAGVRIRRITGQPQGTRHSRNLVVVMTKFDAWNKLLQDPSLGEPFVEAAQGRQLDLGRVERRSQQLKALLQATCPEVVFPAESLSEQVSYIAVSALGPDLTTDARSGQPAIRTRQIKPIWATVPLLYGLHLNLPGSIPARKGQS